MDEVARFHLRNGAALHAINWMGDVSRHGLQASAGMMVNYLYDLPQLESNAARFGSAEVPMGEQARQLLDEEARAAQEHP